MQLNPLAMQSHCMTNCKQSHFHVDELMQETKQKNTTIKKQTEHPSMAICPDLNTYYLHLYWTHT